MKPGRPCPRPRGDEAELFARLGGPLEQVVRTRVSGPAAAVEDACAFAWEQLLQTQPDRGDRLFGWLVTVATHEGWRLVRIERRDEHLDAALVPSGEIDHVLRERAHEALEALAGLRPAERRVLTLHVAGYSYREAMQVESRSYSWVNRHMARARRRLRGSEGGEN